MSLSFTKVPFSTNLHYPTAFNNISEFDLRLWVPVGGQRPSEIAILVHGFLEGIEADPRKRDRWVNIRYRFIAEELGRRGIASIFLPMPLHFERVVPAAQNGVPTIVERLKQDGTYLYYGGHDQFSRDIGILIDSIAADPTKYSLAPASPKIHLIGYSLGGAAAMAAATANQGKVESLSVLFSAWGLAKISADQIGKFFGESYSFSASDWTSTVSQLNASRAKFDEGFKAVMWGEFEADWFGRLPSRILFFHGLKDELFSLDMTISASQEAFIHFSKTLAGLDSLQSAKRDIAFINSHVDHLFFPRVNQVAAMVASFVGVPR